MPATFDEVDRVRRSITANADRCMQNMKRAVWHPWSTQPHTKVQEEIRLWFLEWERVLLKHYATLINDCDSIIGKKWHHEHTGMRCPRQWERVS